MKFLPSTFVVYPYIAFSETLYSYKYPSVSYFAKLLNVYVFPFHTTVASTVSSTLPGFVLVLVNTNLISVALLCVFPPSIHVFVPLISILSFISDIVFVKLFPDVVVSYPFISVSDTLYVYTYPFASYFDRLLNV